MVKHIIKLSTALKVLLILILLGVSALVIAAKSTPLFKLVFHAEMLLLFAIASYLIIEYVGVGNGWVEDDVGIPPEH